MLSCRRILCLNVVLAALALPVAAVIPLEESETAFVEVGSDLTVSWSEAPPDTPLLLRLVDETGRMVVEVPVDSDEEGSVEETHLWPKTGLVGCDPDSDPNVEDYRFRDFGEAEAVLVNRVFGIEVREADFGTLLLYKSVVLAANFQECVYFSDAAGCPRQRFRQSEEIYLTGRRLPTGPNRMNFFLIPAGELPEVGESLVEVRPEYEGAAQRFPVSAQNTGPGGVDFIVLVGDAGGSPAVGCYRGVVRRGNDAEALLLVEDQWAEFAACGDTWNKAVSVNIVVRTQDKPDDGPDCPEASP